MNPWYQKLLRRESLDAISRWLKDRWLWFRHFLPRLGSFAISSEHRQIRLLENTVRQKDAYIRFMYSGILPDTEEEPLTLKRRILETASLLLAAIGFILKKCYRFCILRSHHLDFSPAGTAEKFGVYAGSGNRLQMVPEGRRPLPGGLVFLRYTLETRTTGLRPVLHVDPGSGFNQEYSIPLPPPTNLEQVQLIELPTVTHALELDPGNAGEHVELRDFTLTETNVLLAAWYLHKQCGFTLAQGLRLAITRRLPRVPRPLAHKPSYDEWLLKYDTLTPLDRKAIMDHISTLSDPPLFSLILRPDEDDPEALRESALSINAQLYGNWEILLIVDEESASFDPAKSAIWEKDPRTRIIRGKDIPSTWREAVMAAEGHYTAIMPPGDLLPPHALYLLADKVIADHNLQAIYTDHDVIGETGYRSDPCFKPDWNPDLFLGSDYLRHLCFYRSDKLQEAFQDGDLLPASMDYRVMAMIPDKAVGHVPFVLYHRRKRNISDETETVSPAAVQDYLDRTDHTATVAANPLDGRLVRVVHPVSEPAPKISLIVITRNRYVLLANSLRGLLQDTDYGNLEVIVIDNGSDEADILNYLNDIAADPRVQVIRRDETSNFSALYNTGVSHASGEFIGLVNNGISVIEPLWLKEMAGQLQRPGVGVVGAKIIYGNETIEHGGMIVGVGGVCGNAFRHFPRHHPGYCSRLLLAQEMSGVTAVCMLTTRVIYNDVGGLDADNLKVAFYDMDFCLKVRASGYRIIWTPFAELCHLESAASIFDLSAEKLANSEAEYDYIREKWADVLRRDPNYNPNLSITDEDFSLANPPRVIKPWEPYLFRSTG